MASQALLNILNQGVKIWNRWREEAFMSDPDLSGADLSGVFLIGADLSGVNLSGANLSKANLLGAYLHHTNLHGAYLAEATLGRTSFIGAKLSEADLSDTDLRGTDLSEAYLGYAKLNSADLSSARLGKANFIKADLSGVKLIGADLSGADLSSANLSEAVLNEAVLRDVVLFEADLSRAYLRSTVFAGNDLSTIKGLETVNHRGPSTVGADTLFKSQGKIPEVFLRGAGLSDWQIEASKLYRPELSNQELGDILYRIHDLRVHQAIQINPLFISYNHTDGIFVDSLERYLVDDGVRFWRDVHHATAGRLETQVDRAIRLNPTMLLILSESSVKSDWVEHEVRLARELEKESGRDVLCPIALDGGWENCRWPQRLREQIMEYNILDFSNWQDRVTFDRMYRKLAEGLDLFYRGKNV